MKNLILSLCKVLLVILPTHFANAQTAPAWTTRVGQVDWQRVTSLGYLVVSTTGRLHAIDPETGKVLWENKSFSSIRQEDFDEIIGTRYLKINYGTEPGAIELPMIALVDVITGNVLFDSKQERLGVLDSYALSQSGKFLVVGVQPGKFSAKLLMYDMETGAKLWENEEIFKGTVGGKGGLLAKVAAAAQSLANMQSLTSPPLETDNEHVMITHPNYIIKIKSADGTTVWRTKIEESQRAQLVFSPARPNIVFAGAETESEGMMSSSSGEQSRAYTTNYYALDINNGQPLWKSPVRTQNEQLNTIIPTDAGLMIFPGPGNNPGRTNLNLIDYSGNTLWGNKGRGVRADGAVVDYLDSDAGLVICTEAIGMNRSKGEEYYLNVLDTKTGALKFEKSLKLKGRLVNIETVPKGILFTTTHEVNIADLNTKSFVLPNSIESGGPKRQDKIIPFPVTSRDDKLYVFATKEGIVKELDKNTGAVRSLNSVKLELGGKEVPKSMDAFEDGVVLCSDQNIAMIGYDGLLKFNQYFTPPRQSGFMRALAAAEAIRSAYVGVVMATASVAYAGVAGSSGDAEVKQAGTTASLVTGGLAAYSFAYTGKALADFNRRFKATTATDDYLIVLSEVAPRDFRLLQVDKRTGKTITTLDLGKDRDPVYELDFIDHYLYHVSGGSEITCYKLRGS